MIMLPVKECFSIHSEILGKLLVLPFKNRKDLLDKILMVKETHRNFVMML